MRSLNCCLFLLLLSAPAHAFDCVKAATSIEKAICAAPALMDQDKQLSAAYDAVRQSSKPDERRMLAAAQKRWIGQREAQCDAQFASNPASCIEGETAKRIAFLTGQPETGSGYGKPLIPVIIQQEGSRTRLEYDYSLLRFAKPGTKAEGLLNDEMAKITADVKLGNRGQDSGDQIFSKGMSATLTFASPKLMSILLSSYQYEGGAHPNSGTGALNIDMTSGVQLKAADVFEPKAQADLAADCVRQLIAVKLERNKEFSEYDIKSDANFQEKTVAESVGDFSRWSIYAGKAVVNFDVYEVGAYAEGPYECEFPMAKLKSLAKSPNPLP
jgi:uncharacterized protein YecT (DUF1311 family)